MERMLKVLEAGFEFRDILQSQGLEDESDFVEEGIIETSKAIITIAEEAIRDEA